MADLEYLLACVEACADKFPVPDHMRLLVARVRAALPKGGLDGWRLVPAKATRGWARHMANTRQGQSSAPRCEPPGEYAIQWAYDRIAEVLAAAPPAGDEKEGKDVLQSREDMLRSLEGKDSG